MSRARDLADLGGSADAGGLTGRNLIINGAMNVAQRGTSETGVTTTGVFVLDRFGLNVADTAEYTISQSTTTPDGFANSMKWDNTTANASPSSGQYALFTQKIEGQNLQHLKYGTASAESMTISFWVRSNKTGTYILELLQPDASNRHINKSYTISSADTWEYKTITFPGDTSGVINNDNGDGLQVTWWLGAGSGFTSGTLQTSWGALDNTARAVGNVNLSDSDSNEWYITGVQLEVGETATPFEHEDYGTTLAKCLRYYNRLGLFFARVRNESASSQSPDFVTTITFPSMRDAPTISTYTDANYSSSGTTSTGGSALTFINISKSSANASMNSSSSGAQNISNTAYLELDKEL